MKNDGEDSDGELDHESMESSWTSTDSSDSSHSNYSSEMDLAECERRRDQCLNNLHDLESQYITLRHQLYEERMAEVNSKLKELHEGIAKEYLMHLKELQENMRTRVEVAEIQRKLQLENIENGFMAEDQAARQDYENEKVLLFDSMKEELEEEIRILVEDRSNADIQSDILVTENGKETAERVRRKPVTVRGPYIVYKLPDSEILEDLTAIKKALNNNKREPD